MQFQINITKFIKQLLHPVNLTEFNIQWHEALVYPLRNLLTRFNSKCGDDFYKLEHTGQVCYLRGMLNDTFDKTQRRISITNPSVYEFVFFYPEADDKAVYFDSDQILFPSEQMVESSNRIKFIVNVPAIILTYDAEIRMNSLIRFYKLPAKSYLIVKS
jgi:hypothetical protein